MGHRDTGRRILPAMAVAATVAGTGYATPPAQGAARAHAARAPEVVIPARVLRVKDWSARGALLRFAATKARVSRASLRLYATAASNATVTVRASACPAGRAASGARTDQRGGTRAVVLRGLAAGWNVIALPARVPAAGAATCLRVTTRSAHLRLAAAGRRAPRLVLERGTSGAASGGPARRPGSRPPASVPQAPAMTVSAPARAWAPPVPLSSPGYCATVAGSWPATGRTHVVRPGESLQAAIDGAAPGDTVELADGVYPRASVTIDEPVRLRAASPLGAVFVGNATPRTANDTSVGTPTPVAVRVRAPGAMVEGLDIRLYGVGIDVADVAGAVVQGNRITSSYGVGVNVWDTSDSEVRCNELLDPYLGDDPVASLAAGSIVDAQMDYGVATYGSIRPRVHHNYFHGVFNQALSFKEGNRDPYAGYNTFEGFNLTALFFGQNRPHNGPYEVNGLPTGPDRGTLVAEFNVFRNVYGLRGSERVVYFARSPIRVWHVDGATTLRGNVVESAREGVRLECRSGAEEGCAAGTIRLEGNVLGGAVQDLSGAATAVNRTAGVLLYDGLRAQVTLDGNVFAMVPATAKAYAGGFTGTPSMTETGSVVVGGTAVIPALRQAQARTDPDLSYGLAFR